MYCFSCNTFMPFECAYQMREHYQLVHREEVPSEWATPASKTLHYIQKTEGRLSQYIIQ